MSATQYKRVVLEGPVRNRQDGTFYIGSTERFIDANLIDTTDSHVKSVEDIPAPPAFVVGQLYRTGLGSIVMRTANADAPWTVVIPRRAGYYVRSGDEYAVVSEPVTLVDGPIAIAVVDGKVVAK